MAASELLAISRKLKPLLSKGILIAFSEPTGGKGKLVGGGLEEGAERQRQSFLLKKKGKKMAASNFPHKVSEWLHCSSLLVGGNSMPINVKGYACFNIGFVSLWPVNTRCYWSGVKIDDGDKKHQGKKERLKVKDVFLYIEGDIWAGTGNRWSLYKCCC